MKLDFSLESAAERTEFVRKLLEELPQEQKTPRYLEILSDYIIFALDKEERKQKKIITDNRSKRIKVRETSFQGLISKLENGEDGIYNMIANDKNIIFMPATSITPKDIEEIPALKELTDEIKNVEEQFKAATGKKKFLLKKQLIQMYQDQYVIKNTYKPQMYVTNAVKSVNTLNLDETITVDEDNNLHSNGLISFVYPSHISALLCNYSKLKEQAWGQFHNDAYYLMESLDALIESTFEEYPMYKDIIIYKIDGISNIEIKDNIMRDYNVSHTVEYISSLWRKKLPKMMADKFKEEYLTWYYTTQKYGKWKRCSRCGQIKLADPLFFSKNKTMQKKRNSSKENKKKLNKGVIIWQLLWKSGNALNAVKCLLIKQVFII